MIPLAPHHEPAILDWSRAIQNPARSIPNTETAIPAWDCRLKSRPVRLLTISSRCHPAIWRFRTLPSRCKTWSRRFTCLFRRLTEIQRPLLRPELLTASVSIQLGPAASATAPTLAATVDPGPGMLLSPYAIDRLAKLTMCSRREAASPATNTASSSDGGLPPAVIGSGQGILSYPHLKTKRYKVLATSNNSFQFTLSRFRTLLSRFKTRNRRFSRKRRLR